MDNVIYQTSTLTVRDPEVEEFSWNFKISPRSKIQKNIESVTFGGFSFTGLQFKTGFLSEIDHKWGVTFYSNQINVQMTLPLRDRNHRYKIKPSSLQLISLEEVKATHKLNFQEDTRVAPTVLWGGFWVNSDGSWDDSVDTIQLIFRVSREFSGTCLQSLVSDECTKRNKAALSFSKILDSTEFFMNPHLSDVTIQCKNEIFPGHRFLLSCRSPVFSQMFRAGMKEQNEGLVAIDDVEPEVMKLLLKFMYYGDLETSGLADVVCKELFQAADKYNLEGLKVICEHELMKKITRDNCLEMYATAYLYEAKMLKDQCRDMIRLNKREIFYDRQIFKQFSEKYPDLTYELFHSIG